MAEEEVQPSLAFIEEKAPVATPVSKKFGPSLSGHYPDQMRRQLWPLCCGASILSGFKNIMNLTEEQLLAKINSTINDMIPDLQVYSHEVIRPKLTFLTLNTYQMGSKKIMDAIKAAGFIKFAEATPRGGVQGFFVKDTTKTFKAVA